MANNSTFTTIRNYVSTEDNILNTYDQSLPDDARLAKKLAFLSSDSSKTLVNDTQGIIIHRYPTTSNPKTKYNQNLKLIGGVMTFDEYEILDSVTPINLNTLSKTNLDVLKATTAGKTCASLLDQPIQEGTIVKIEYSLANPREGMITKILGRAPLTQEDVAAVKSFSNNSKDLKNNPATKSFKKALCEDASKFLAETKKVNEDSTQVDNKKAPYIKFYSSINCGDVPKNFNPSPDGSDKEMLSKYFTLQDLTISTDLAIEFGVKNEPDEEQKKNLIKLATSVLDPIVEIYKKTYSGMREGIPFRINSAFRSQTLNTLATGKNNFYRDAEILTDKTVSSGGAHTKGLAADLFFDVQNLDDFLNIYENIKNKKSTIKWSYLLLESMGANSIWIHIETETGKDSVQMWGPFTDNGGGSREYLSYNRNLVKDFLNGKVFPNDKPTGTVS